MTGLLPKSKSFNGSDRKRKVQFLEKGPEKQKFLRETAVSSKGKSCAFRSLKKSLSFNDGSSAGRSYALDAEPKTITPKHSVVSDTKRLRSMKECGSAEMEAKPVLKKPRIFPPGGLSSVSSGEKKFGTCCEPISTNFSGTKCSDIKTSQILIESGNSRHLTYIANSKIADILLCMYFWRMGIFLFFLSDLSLKFTQNDVVFLEYLPRNSYCR